MRPHEFCYTGNMKKYDVPKRKSRIDWQTIVLRTVSVVGVVSVAVVAPNALQMFKVTGKQSVYKQNINRASVALRKRGLLKLTNEGWILTKKGKEELVNFEFQTSDKNIRWDGKWRQIIFDIKEERRGVRNRVREFLQNAGFVMVQKSVWMYPYPCGEVIALLKKELGLKDQLLYSIIEKLDLKTERKLKKEFKLK